MNRSEILEKIQNKGYFGIKEFVDNSTFTKFGERAWQFIDTDLLHTMLIIRETLNKPITINHGTLQQRGLRTNICQIVKNKTNKNLLYLSAHVMGKAVDFDVKGMTADQVRKWLVDNSNILPCKIRLENKLRGKSISWVHLDVYWSDRNPKVYLFNI